MSAELSLARRILAIFLGGFFGTIARYLLSQLIQSYLGKGWPYDILLINLTGAYFLALFTTLADAAMFINPTRRLFLNVGFLGAYTTFSSLALGDALLLGKAQWLAASAYLALSIPGGVIMALLGDLAGRWLIKHGRRAAALLRLNQRRRTRLPSYQLDVAARSDLGETPKMLLVDDPDG